MPKFITTHTRIADLDKPRVVVIGGGFGGLEVIKALRAWMFVHLMSLVGFINKVFTFLSWAWNYFRYDRSNRLIIGRNEEKLTPEEIEAAYKKSN